MAKFKITAGAEVDLITKKEMEEALRSLASWMVEASIGARYTRIHATGLIAGGAMDFGSEGSAGQILAPPPGFIWDVRRLRITGIAAADVANIYMGDANPSSLIATSGDIAGDCFLWSEQVILYPGDSLRIVGSGLSATGTVTASGLVRELPMSLAWRLGG